MKSQESQIPLPQTRNLHNSQVCELRCQILGVTVKAVRKITAPYFHIRRSEVNHSRSLRSRKSCHYILGLTLSTIGESRKLQHSAATFTIPRLRGITHTILQNKIGIQINLEKYGGRALFASQSHINSASTNMMYMYRLYPSTEYLTFNFKCQINFSHEFRRV